MRLLLLALAPLLAPLLAAAPTAAQPVTGAWVARPAVALAPAGRVPREVAGHVFEDVNGDGRRQPGEPGVAGIVVSNGEAVTRTDREGRWRLPLIDDMNLMIVQPSGWQVPVDERLVPQFHHVWKRGGTGERLRFGGLPAARAPQRVDFPLRRAPRRERFSCAILGDTQVYSGAEVGYFRDGVLADLLRDPPGTHACLLYLGDQVGDDLGLMERLLALGARAGAPQWWVVGNHDIDLDARQPGNSADTFRRVWGPDHYAFELGDTLVVVLNNVVYPCGAEDLPPAGADDDDRRACAGPRPAYNGRVPRRQMRWLEALLAATPADRRVVLATHIPFVSFVDAATRRHQTDNLADIYRLVGRRRALSLSGHTHTLENHAPGQVFAGWEALTGGPLPFRHIVAGAASGGWYQHDFDAFGVPLALQRMGAPRGHLRLDFTPDDIVETYVGSRLEPDRVAWLSMSTPAFRRWADAILAWHRAPREGREPTPPLSAHDLPDPRIVTRADLAEGVFLAANVWAGDAATRVEARLGGRSLVFQRTQQGAGEAARTGAEWGDPFALMRQLSVGRVAMQSRSGDERNQGVELFRGARTGPAPPQPLSVIADRNMHLWHAALPADLSQGVHVAEVAITDRHGRRTHERMAFEVADTLPPARFRRELFAD